MSNALKLRRRPPKVKTTITNALNTMYVIYCDWLFFRMSETTDHGWRVHLNFLSENNSTFMKVLGVYRKKTTHPQLVKSHVIWQTKSGSSATWHTSRLQHTAMKSLVLVYIKLNPCSFRCAPATLGPGKRWLDLYSSGRPSSSLNLFAQPLQERVICQANSARELLGISHPTAPADVFLSSNSCRITKESHVLYGSSENFLRSTVILCLRPFLMTKKRRPEKEMVKFSWPENIPGHVFGHILWQ